MKKILLWSVLLFPILFAACGWATPPQQALPSPMPLPTQQQNTNLTGKWTMDMQLSGGIAGLSRSIEISSDGTVTAKDERNGKTAKGQLTPDELTQFTTLVNAISLKSASGAPSGCADCFNYNIAITSDSGKFTAHFDDLSLLNSDMRSVIKYLAVLMDRILASG